MADIRKRPDKKKPYQVRFTDLSTKSGFGYRSFHTMKAARQFSAEKELVDEQGSQSPNSMRVDQAVSLWLDVCGNIGRDGREIVEPLTLVEYQRRGKVICEYPWQKPIQQLLPTDIIAFRTWLLEDKSRDLARRAFSSFHSVILEMMHQGYMTTDPAAGLTIKANGRYEDREVQIPNNTEISDLYSAIDQLVASKHSQKRRAWQRYRPMFYLAGFSGMRPSEYRGLPWRSVQEHTVEVTQRADKNGIIGPVKSRAAKRTIFLPEIVTDLLSEWRLISDGQSDELVFPTDSRSPLLLSNIFYRAWVPLMEEAGLMETVITPDGSKQWPKYSMYCLRHYFASKLIESGQDFKYIQNVMGHSKIEITFNNYGHLIKGNEDAYKAAANTMASSVLNRCGQNVAETV